MPSRCLGAEFLLQSKSFFISRLQYLVAIIAIIVDIAIPVPENIAGCDYSDYAMAATSAMK